MIQNMYYARLKCGSYHIDIYFYCNVVIGIFFIIDLSTLSTSNVLLHNIIVKLLHISFRISLLLNPRLFTHDIKKIYLESCKMLISVEPDNLI